MHQDNYDLKYQSIPGDGHCLFHAVSFYCALDQQQLRSILANHMRNYSSEYENLINGLENSNKSLNEYLEDLEQGIEWADDISIAVIMKLLDRPIIIVDPNNHIRNLSEIEDDNGEAVFNGDPIFVYYNGHNHYDALLLVNLELNGRVIFNKLKQGNVNIQIEGHKEQSILNSLVQFNLHQNQSIVDNNFNLEESALTKQQSITNKINLFQEIYDICEARIQRNNELIKYIKSFNTLQKLKGSNLFPQNKKNIAMIDYLWSGYKNFDQCKHDILKGVNRDIRKYEKIKSKIVEITQLINKNFVDPDICINSSSESIKLWIELIKMYNLHILIFWFTEDNEKRFFIYHQNFSEHYYIKLIKEKWEQLLPTSFKPFQDKFGFISPAKYAIQSGNKKVAEYSRIKFKLREYLSSIHLLLAEYKKLKNKLNQKQIEIFNELQHTLNAAEAKIIDFCNKEFKFSASHNDVLGKKYFIQKWQPLSQIFKNLADNTPIGDTCTELLKKQYVNLEEIFNDILKPQKMNNAVKAFEEPLDDDLENLKESRTLEQELRFEKYYIFYIAFEYLKEVLQVLQNKLPPTKAKYKITSLTKKLQLLEFSESKSREKIYKGEHKKQKKILNALQTATAIIDCQMALELSLYQEGIRRNNVENTEQRFRKAIHFALQQNLQKQENLAKQSKRYTNRRQPIIDNIEDNHRKPILDTRIFTIDTQVILTNYRRLEELMDNRNSITFEQAEIIVIALGGRIETNSGSHHKIVFQERLRSCFDTIASIVKPHGNSKENEITGFALESFKAAIRKVLPENWRTYRVAAINKLN